MTPPPELPLTDDALTAEGGALPESFQRQCVLDTAGRMNGGLLLYPVIWPILMAIDATYRQHPLLAYGNAFGLLLMSALRLSWNRQLPQQLTRNFERARRIFRGLSLLQNLYWGLLCAYLMTQSSSESLRWLMLVTTVGITAGGTVIVAIDAVLPLLYPVVMLTPSVLSLVPQGGLTNLTMAALTVIFLAYSISISRVVGRDYWLRLRSQALLEHRANELEAISRTDALTRIPNRLSFQERLQHTWRDARRRNESLALAIVDLDHFKRINDTHGHPFGDRCLVAAAHCLTDIARRPNDLVARYGGEEFVVLMPNTGIEGARHVASVMLHALCGTSVTDEAQQAMAQLSCSIGVASCQPGPHNHMGQLIEDADAALYFAKHNGRGQVACHGVDWPLAEGTDASGGAKGSAGAAA